MTPLWDNSLNLAVIHWLSQYAPLSAHFNQIVHYIEGANLFKGLPTIGLVWYYWFRDQDESTGTRRRIIAILIGCLVAVLIARVVNNLLPFEPRPFANSALPLPAYAGMPPPEGQSLFHLNSFPSDHATLFFGLAMGIYLISRRMGIIVFLYVALFIALPRMYLGLHYPTDILAGALLGIACVLLFTREGIVSLYDRQRVALLDKYPAAFQVVLFIISVEISTLFDDVRKFLSLIRHFF